MDHKHDTKKIINRLSRIEGHLRSVREMVETGRDCTEVLIQMAAVRSALERAGRVILEDHIEHCIAEAQIKGKRQKAIDELKAALKQFIG